MEILPPWMSFQLVAFTKELQIRKLHQWHSSIPLQETWLVYAASLLTATYAGSKASWISRDCLLAIEDRQSPGNPGLSTCQQEKNISPGLWCQHIPTTVD